MYLLNEYQNPDLLLCHCSMITMRQQICCAIWLPNYFMPIILCSYTFSTFLYNFRGNGLKHLTLYILYNLSGFQIHYLKLFYQCFCTGLFICWHFHMVALVYYICFYNILLFKNNLKPCRRQYRKLHHINLLQKFTQPIIPDTSDTGVSQV